MSLDFRRTIINPKKLGTVYEVVAPFLPLKRTPSQEAGLETQVLRGEYITVYDTQEGWVYGQLEQDKYVGWVPLKGLYNPSPAPDGFKLSPSPLSEEDTRRGREGSLVELSPPHTHKVSVPRTFTYPTASMKQPVLDALSLGSTLNIVSAEADFAFTSQNEYIWAAHLSPLDDYETDYTSIAEQFLRIPYLWGGKTSLGLDCSGLVQVALQAAGINAPRDSDMQAQELGEAVPFTPEFSNLKRGDLICWKGHIGIMRDEINLLHANGYHMQVVSEPLLGAVKRIAKNSYGEVGGIRRIL